MTREQIKAWEHSQRARFKKGLLESWKLKPLKKIGFDFNSQMSNFIPFEEARKFVESLGLKSINQWYKHVKRNDFPKNIPKSPEYFYKNTGYTNISDWLGCEIAYNLREYLPFEEARTFVHSLKLRKTREWIEWFNKNKPMNIPRNAYQTYKDSGWISFKDWLGCLEKFLSFEEAKEFMKRENLKSYVEWTKWKKDGKCPSFIPKVPYWVYKKHPQWKGIPNFLGYA